MVLTISEIISATGGKLVCGDPGSSVFDVTIDSRRVKNGDLFIALKGAKHDAHEFIDQAIHSGASAVLTNTALGYTDKNAAIIEVKDTLEALQKLAKYHLMKFDIPKVAVTGSTGKTSTKDLIYSVLSQKYHCLKSEGNYNNHIGVPLTIFKIKPEHEIAIFEMGMSGFGEIELLADMVRPNIAVITNIGVSHIEHLGSQENILKAKMEIATFLQHKDFLIVNCDDPLLRSIDAQRIEYSKICTGIGEESDYMASGVAQEEKAGIRFSVRLTDTEASFRLNMPGLHNVNNALLAIAVGNILNVENEQIEKGLVQHKGSEKRLSIFETEESITVIDDAYNASPDSMRAAFSVLSSFDSVRKIAVIGDMLEMGTFSEKFHRQVGEDAASAGVDIVVAVGDYRDSVAEGAKLCGITDSDVHLCSNNQEAINVLKKIVEKGDCILVKGSRGMKMEEIAAYLKGGSH